MDDSKPGTAQDLSKGESLGTLSTSASPPVPVQGDCLGTCKQEVLLKLLDSSTSQIMTWHNQAYVALIACVAALAAIVRSAWPSKDFVQVDERLYPSLALLVVLVGVAGFLYLRIAWKNYGGNWIVKMKCEYALGLHELGAYLRKENNWKFFYGPDAIMREWLAGEDHNLDLWVRGEDFKKTYKKILEQDLADAKIGGLPGKILLRWWLLIRKRRLGMEFRDGILLVGVLGMAVCLALSFLLALDLHWKPFTFKG
jgi:hypothetical protein